MNNQKQNYVQRRATHKLRVDKGEKTVRGAKMGGQIWKKERGGQGMRNARMYKCVVVVWLGKQQRKRRRAN